MMIRRNEEKINPCLEKTLGNSLAELVSQWFADEAWKPSPTFSPVPIRTLQTGPAWLVPEMER
jgi:hypothetical protein